MGQNNCTTIVRWRHAEPSDSPDRLLFFPPLRSGELLYSGIARFHHLLGSLNGAHTLQVAIGRRNAKFRTAAVPSYIAALSDRLPAHHPQSGRELLLDEHTVVPMLTYFLDEKSRSAVRQRFVSDLPSAGSLAMLGHTKHRHMDFHRSLALCRKCVVRDAELGLPHWHVEHQIPGTFYCAEHGELLVIGCERCGPSVRSNSVPSLPSLDCIQGRHRPIFVSRPPAVPEEELVLLARESAVMTARPEGQGTRNWCETEKALLLRQGFVRLSVLDRKKIYDHLRSQLSEGLLRWIGCVDESRSSKYSWIGMLFNWRTRSPALDCLVFTLGFHGSLDSYEKTAREVELSESVIFEDDVWNAKWKNHHEKHFHDASNLLRAARSLNSTLSELLAGRGRGSRVDQRKRELRNRALAFIVTGVRAGVPVRSIARRLMVPKDIVQECLTEGDALLSSDAQTVEFARARERCRTIVAKFLAQHPAATRAEVLHHIKARATWLKRFDADWYDKVLPRKKPPGLPRREPTSEEDAALADRLKAAATALRQRASIPRLTAASLASEAGASSFERSRVLPMPRCAAVVATEAEAVDAWWKRRLRAYVAIAGAVDEVITSNRIKQEHHLPLNPPEWMHAFIREEALRQGYAWVAKRSPWHHPNRSFSRGPRPSNPEDGRGRWKRRVKTARRGRRR